MDLLLPIFFFIFGFFCMVFAFFEERDTNDVDSDEESKSDNLILILLVSSLVIFFISSASFMNVTSSYYSTVSDSMVTVHEVEYRPVAYLPLGFAIFMLLLSAVKGFQMLDRARNID